MLRFEVILQHDWPTEQCLLHIRVFFGGKTKRPWSFDKTNNEHLLKQGHSKIALWKKKSYWEYLGAVQTYPDICEERFFPVLAFCPHINSVFGHQKRNISKTVPERRFFWERPLIFVWTYENEGFRIWWCSTSYSLYPSTDAIVFVL